jgi:hypothetical protein
MVWYPLLHSRSQNGWHYWVQWAVDNLSIPPNLESFCVVSLLPRSLADSANDHCSMPWQSSCSWATSWSLGSQDPLLKLGINPLELQWFRSYSFTLLDMALHCTLRPSRFLVVLILKFFFHKGPLCWLPICVRFGNSLSAPKASVLRGSPPAFSHRSTRSTLWSIRLLWMPFHVPSGTYHLRCHRILFLPWNQGIFLGADTNLDDTDRNNTDWMLHMANCT